MDEQERNALAALPYELTIFRGIGHVTHSWRGMSWTLDEQKAIWFSRRFADERDRPVVYRGLIEKARVLAHLLGRKEAEVVVFPRNVKQVERV
jgi:hypothetical protein